MWEIFEKNLKAYIEAYPTSEKKIKSLLKKKPEKEVRVNPSYDRIPIISVIDTDGIEKFFSGKYNPNGPIEEKLKEWGKIERSAPFIFIGMNNMCQVRSVLEKATESNPIIIYEPSVDVFRKVMEEIDIADLLKKEKIVLCVDKINGDLIELTLKKVLSYELLSVMKVFYTQGYEKVYQEKVNDFALILRKVIKDKLVTVNTVVRFSNVYGENIIRNTKYLYDIYNFRQLAGVLRNEIPVILVSAGPSLNKNIEDLKLAEGKACIIAVDTAIKPLLNRGIKPDFFAIVDGLKPTNLIEHEGIHDVPMLTSMVVASGVMGYHKGKKIMHASDNPLEEELFLRAGAESTARERLIREDLPSGGSVACSAFSFAKFIGASEIILVGQDLALTGNKTHADGTFHDKMPGLTKEEREKAFEVEGINGKPVLTRGDFKLYLDWFEDQIKHQPQYKVIDATQGGAKIHGSKVMSLKKAIATYCTKKFSAYDMWENIPEMMDNGAKRAFAREYAQIPERMKEVTRKARKTKKIYGSIISELKTGTMTDERFSELLKELAPYNKYFNEDKYALFVGESLQRLDKLIRSNLYKEEDDLQEERMLLLRQGELFCHQMIYVSRVLEKGSRLIFEENPIIYEPQPTNDPLELMQMALEEAGVK